MKKLLRLSRRGHQPEIEALSALIDGRLELPRASALDAHVASCEACSVLLRQMRETKAVLRAMPDVEAPRSFRLRRADIEAAPRQPSRQSPMLRWSPAVAGVAVAVFAVVLGADLITRDSGASPLATREFDQRTGTILDSDDAFSQEASKAAGADASAPGPGGGAIQPPDTGTSIAVASGPPSEASTDAPVAAAPTPGATEAPVEAMIPADTGDGAPEAGEDASAPTGSAPNGDLYVPAPGAALPSDESAPEGTPVVEDATGRTASVVSPTPAGELAALSSESEEGDDGNREAFLFVEIAAVLVAVLSGGTFVAWRIRRRENG